ncbi:hypothetical protein RUM44_008698 [Polyplax serrata]|uniref:G-protein coupled receptors family 2 profile 2 domain-containing protein n=2 Tax=Polyplax serrata TaxID=468196 RepID=A0ABR1BCY3_POLSC
MAVKYTFHCMILNLKQTPVSRDLRPTSLDKSQEVWRLRMYQVYAWGVPTIIAMTAIVFDHLPPGTFPSVLKPKFAIRNCWFYGDLEIFTYFFGPVGILLILNLVLFALTARELTCGLWRSEVVKSTTERATLGKVCLKLVVVMGITWIADVTSWAVGGQSAWYVTDIINALQGVFIFIVVGCQPQIWATFRRLWCFRETTTTSMNGNQQSCSQDVPSLGDSTFNNTQNTSLKIPVGETLC